MRRLVPAAATVAALLLGGCGIPADTGVKVIGPPPSRGTSVGDDGVLPPQYTRESSTEPGQFVEYYLQAAAGDPEGAANRVKAFQSPELAAGFEPGPDVRVVRLTERPLHTPGSDQVTIYAQQVGTLKGNGVLEPQSDPSGAKVQYTLQVRNLPDRNGLFVTSAPKLMLMTDDALDNFYQRRTIYFWNTARTGLVPDLRYMPLSVPTVQQPTTILSWLASGPAKWLGDAVEALPQGTTVPDNVPAISDDTLRISLSVEAVPPNDEPALDRLRRQLQWSLRPLEPPNLELKIGHQNPVRFANAEYRSSNAAFRLADVPERFVIFNSQIRRLSETPHAEDPVPVLKADANRNIARAAMSSSATHRYAAVVGTGRSPALRVAAAPIGEEAALKDVGGLSGTLGRPVWAVTPDGAPSGAIGLITVNGKVYSFGPAGGRAQPVQWQTDPGPVSSLVVAPDGQRVAFVAGGKLYRTVLKTGGDALTLGSPEQLRPPSLTSVAAVAWSSQTYLAVAGRRSDGRYTVLDVSVDGALPFTRLFSDIGTEPVTYLTAFPANPVTREENSDAESYVAAGVAWDVLGDPVRILAKDVIPQQGDPAGAVPSEPFFLN